MAQKSVPELKDVEESKMFWVNNGPAVRNLSELHSTLRIMNDDTFKHHVNEERNDFSRWISDVVGDTDLSNKLENMKTKKETVETLQQRLTELNSIRIPKKLKKKTPKRIKSQTQQVKKTIVGQLPELKNSFFKMKEDISTAAIFFIAIAVLFVVIGLVNLSEAVITGAVVTEIQSEASVFSGGLVFIGLLAALAIATKKIREHR